MDTARRRMWLLNLKAHVVNLAENAGSGREKALQCVDVLLRDAEVVDDTYIGPFSYIPVDENGNRITRDDWKAYEWTDATTPRDRAEGLQRFERGKWWGR